MATRTAVDLSNRIGSELHVAHAWAPIHHDTYPVTCCSRTPDYSHLYADDARKLIAGQIKQIENNEEESGRVTEAYLRKGQPINEIKSLSEELGADLIVLGGKGYNPARRMLMGSFSKNFVRYASCPTLVVQSGIDAWPPATVVIGEEFSEYDGGVGELAMSLGRLFGTRTLQAHASLKPRGISIVTRVMDNLRVKHLAQWSERTSDRRASEPEEALENPLLSNAVVEDLATAIPDAGRTEVPLAAVSIETLDATRRLRPRIESLNPFSVLEAPRWSILVSPRLPRR